MQSWARLAEDDQRYGRKPASKFFMAKSKFPTAIPFLPDSRTLPALRSAAAQCKGCDLWRNATQTVFGEGRKRMRVMMVGEQPGDKEDVQGKPFVGPAGALLDKALEQAGIDRGDVYVTNMVKHFKFEPRGKRRIHKKPTALEVSACRPWLEAEIAAVRPDVVVLLGSTAAQGVLGRDFRVTQHRGEWIPSPLAPMVTATIHPSAILRAPDEESRQAEMARFVADLKLIADRLQLPRAA
jgi:uracil-DNA glycosylase family protein